MFEANSVFEFLAFKNGTRSFSLNCFLTLLNESNDIPQLQIFSSGKIASHWKVCRDVRSSSTFVQSLIVVRIILNFNIVHIIIINHYRALICCFGCCDLKLLYVLDHETNTFIHISCFVGLGIDIWKIHKVVNM